MINIGFFYSLSRAMDQHQRAVGRRDRLRQLRAFCKAAQTESISKAAEKLHLSQPSVSLLVKSLEQDLDVQLFERRGPRIVLTDAGRTLLEAAVPLVEGIDELPRVFDAQANEMGHGHLDIAAGEATILYLLADYLREFNALYPNVSLRLHNVTGRDGLALLRAGEVDCAVGSLLEVPRDIQYQPLCNFDPVLIVARDHALAGREQVTLKEISDCGMILPPRHLSTWRIVDLVFQQHGLRYDVVMEAGGWEVIKRFVELGLGVSIVTSICLTGREDMAVIPLREYFPTRSYGVVTRAGRPLSAQARALVRLLMARSRCPTPTSAMPAFGGHK